MRLAPAYLHQRIVQVADARRAPDKLSACCIAEHVEHVYGILYGVPVLRVPQESQDINIGVHVFEEHQIILKRIPSAIAAYVITEKRQRLHGNVRTREKLMEKHEPAQAEYIFGKRPAYGSRIREPARGDDTCDCVLGAANRVEVETLYDRAEAVELSCTV